MSAFYRNKLRAQSLQGQFSQLKHGPQLLVISLHLHQWLIVLRIIVIVRLRQSTAQVSRLRSICRKCQAYVPEVLFTSANRQQLSILLMSCIKWCTISFTGNLEVFLLSCANKMYNKVIYIITVLCNLFTCCRKYHKNL